MNDTTAILAGVAKSCEMERNTIRDIDRVRLGALFTVTSSNSTLLLFFFLFFFGFVVVSVTSKVGCPASESGGVSASSTKIGSSGDWVSGGPLAIGSSSIGLVSFKTPCDNSCTWSTRTMSFPARQVIPHDKLLRECSNVSSRELVIPPIS